MKTDLPAIHTVQTMTAAEEARAISTMVLAFAADPAARWTWPNAQEYLAHMPRLVRAFGSDAFAHHGAHRVEAYAGVALCADAASVEESNLGSVVGSEVRLLTLIRSSISFCGSGGRIGGRWWYGIRPSPGLA